MPNRIVRPVWSPLLPSLGTELCILEIAGTGLADLRVMWARERCANGGSYFDGHRWHGARSEHPIVGAGKGPLADFVSFDGAHYDDRRGFTCGGRRMPSPPRVYDLEPIVCPTHSVVGNLGEQFGVVLVFMGADEPEVHDRARESFPDAVAISPRGWLVTAGPDWVEVEVEKGGDGKRPVVHRKELQGIRCRGLAVNSHVGDGLEVFAFGDDGQLRLIRFDATPPAIVIPVDTGTRRTLNAGVVLADGSLLVVGEGGLSLRVRPRADSSIEIGYACEIEEPAPGNEDLLTLHVLDDGTVVAGGNRGALFVRRQLVLRPAAGPVQGATGTSAADLVAGLFCLPLTAPVTLADSEDDPPARASRREPNDSGRRGEEERFIPIDELLGTYAADERLITLYMKELRAAARALRLDVALLARIVELHEAGHALLHLGASADGETFDAAAYRRAGSAFHEPLAQLVALTAARALGPDHERAYWVLEERQPDVYRLPVQLRNLTREEVRAMVLDSRRRAMRTS